MTSPEKQTHNYWEDFLTPEIEDEGETILFTFRCSKTKKMLQIYHEKGDENFIQDYAVGVGRSIFPVCLLCFQRKAVFDGANDLTPCQQNFLNNRLLVEEDCLRFMCIKRNPWRALQFDPADYPDFDNNANMMEHLKTKLKESCRECKCRHLELNSK
jgi:hypothetical protein